MIILLQLTGLVRSFPCEPDVFLTPVTGQLLKLLVTRDVTLTRHHTRHGIGPESVRNHSSTSYIRRTHTPRHWANVGLLWLPSTITSRIKLIEQSKCWGNYTKIFIVNLYL